jgi:hypothetical protein
MNELPVLFSIVSDSVSASTSQASWCVVTSSAGTSLVCSACRDITVGRWRAACTATRLDGKHPMTWQKSIARRYAEIRRWTLLALCVGGLCLVRWWPSTPLAAYELDSATGTIKPLALSQGLGDARSDEARVARAQRCAQLLGVMEQAEECRRQGGSGAWASKDRERGGCLGNVGATAAEHFLIEKNTVISLPIRPRVLPSEATAL